MKDKNELALISPLTWAYIGDAVYELYVRNYLINNTNLKPHRLHIQSIKYVKAKAQANILKKIEDYLTDEEKDIVRRGRNTRYSFSSQKCRLYRLHVCNSIRSINRLFIFNETRN